MLIKIDTYFDGAYWYAKGIDEDFFTQGETYDTLLKNIREAVALHCEDKIKKGKTAGRLIMPEMEISGVA